MCLLTWVMGVLSSTSWFIIHLLIYLLFFVVVSAAGRNSTTTCNRKYEYLEKLGRLFASQKGLCSVELMQNSHTDL
jgi:hypothetical protein